MLEAGVKIGHGAPGIGFDQIYRSKLRLVMRDASVIYFNTFR